MKSRMLLALALTVLVLVGCAGNGVAQDAEKKEVEKLFKRPQINRAFDERCAQHITKERCIANANELKRAESVHVL